MVERGGLENRCGCMPTGGSNPSPSAKLVYGQTSEPPAGVGSPFEPMKSRVG